MKSPRFGLSGYTIIEIMIVLAISGVILTSAILLFQGSQGRTAFDVAVQDVSSQIGTTLKEINTAVAQFPSQYTCQSNGINNWVTITNSPQTQGSNTDCIMLGEALYVDTSASQIDSYTVIGCRLANCDSSQDNSQDLPSAWPTTDTSLLKQTYNISSATIKSSNITGNSGTRSSSLVGFYINLSGSLPANTTTLLTYSYDNASSGNILSCIQVTSGSTCGFESGITQWVLCLQSPYDSTKTADVTISSTSKGISNTVRFEACS